MARASAVLTPESVEVLRPNEAAHLLRTTVATLADWRYKRTGPKFVRDGRYVRYRLADLDEWLSSCTERPAA